MKLNYRYRQCGAKLDNNTDQHLVIYKGSDYGSPRAVMKIDEKGGVCLLRGKLLKFKGKTIDHMSLFKAVVNRIDTDIISYEREVIDGDERVTIFGSFDTKDFAEARYGC